MSDLREALALNVMRWRMDDKGDWPIDKVSGALAYATSDHSGDCTKQPWTCMRCECDAAYKQADELVAVVAAHAES